MPMDNVYRQCFCQPATSDHPPEPRHVQRALDTCRELVHARANRFPMHNIHMRKLQVYRYVDAAGSSGYDIAKQGAGGAEGFWVTSSL
jgi:hypothetical protein